MEYLKQFDFEALMVMTLLFLLFAGICLAINSIYDRMVKKKLHDNGLEISEFYMEQLAQLTIQHLGTVMNEVKDTLATRQLLNKEQSKAVNEILNQCIQRTSAQSLILNNKQKKFHGPNKNKYLKVC